MDAAEYIQDTEEYINIELDSSRNRLIRLELVINTATFSIAMYSLVAGEHSWPDSLLLFLAAELIKDTQDYLDIHLDSTQNRLIRLDLLTATATLSVAIYTLVAGNFTFAVDNAKDVRTC